MITTSNNVKDERSGEASTPFPAEGGIAWFGLAATNEDSLRKHGLCFATKDIPSADFRARLNVSTRAIDVEYVGPDRKLHCRSLRLIDDESLSKILTYGATVALLTSEFPCPPERMVLAEVSVAIPDASTLY